MHYALLRDNILHHLEHGRPSASFVEVYRIGQVLGGASQLLRATKLSEELAQARALCERPIDDLALSSRTRAVLSVKQELPSGPPTERVGLMRSLPWLPSRAQRLGDVFGYLIDSLLSITRSAQDEDLVQVFET